ncbi:testis-expressed protein 52-like [Anneissia japonica]|uniref:testis-expressed protein 52-like n=1 Tax=Anneissia japonica TaxID=1529436 RepID=UPI001425B821|nr:testis-expressed protein 52-like [Anneissia japonica]XP_033099199.1 testis-expressed protein 52-like [Anneissia japonica]
MKLGKPDQSYFEDEQEKMTIEERDRLQSDRTYKQSAFCPRPLGKLTTKRLPRTLSNIHVNHKVRSYVDESTNVNPTNAFRLWIESGRREPPFPRRWDPAFDSNVWRNFRTNTKEIVKLDTSGKTVPSLIADMYPMKIPPHSSMGSNTLGKFLSEVPIIENDRLRTMAVARSEKDMKEFKKLKLRSEMRVPPMDEYGYILPPNEFRLYERPKLERVDPNPTPTNSVNLRQMTELERDSQRGVTGTVRTSPTRLWKLSFKDNNPQYKEVMREKLEKSQSMASTMTKKSINKSEVFFK